MSTRRRIEQLPMEMKTGGDREEPPHLWSRKKKKPDDQEKPGAWRLAVERKKKDCARGRRISTLSPSTAKIRRRGKPDLSRPR